MEKNYCEVVKYDIYEAIKILGEDHRKFRTPQEWLHSDDDNPARILNNPLLTNYDWVYENAEKLFYTDKFNYQQYQGIDEYYTLFKVLINKYSLEDDYNRFLCNKKNHMAIEWKWKYFAINLIDFLSHAPNEILIELLNKPDVMEYFLRYPEIYDCETLSSFSYKGIEKLLECSHMATFYKNDYKKLIQLIRRNPQITIPLSIMLDSKVVKDVSRTYRIEDFYQNLYYVREQVSEDLYIEEHKKYCDEQVANIKNDILPCYKDDYNNAKENLSLDDFRYSNRLQYQVIKRIFDRSGVEILPKDYLYKELAKYTLIGMFISRNYETDPYNLFIDIETLYEFATLNNKSLRGQCVYEVLLSYEDRTLEEIVSFYQKEKDFPLIEILYDDWNRQKYDFITELNSQIYKPTFENMTVRDGISCYDITDVEKPILVHNTSISIDDTSNISKMIDDVKRGRKHHICLSVQDEIIVVFMKKKTVRERKH